MQHDTLLVEIGTEELPPKALKGLSEAFTSGLTELLKSNDFAFGDVRPFASARRLAVQIKMSLRNSPIKLLRSAVPLSKWRLTPMVNQPKQRKVGHVVMVSM